MPETHAAVVVVVARRAMDQRGVMQRQLARRERHRHARLAVEAFADALAAVDHVVRTRLVVVLDHGQAMRARDHAHAARQLRRLGERHPGRHMLQRIEEEVGAVLVPAHIGRRVRLLDPHRRVIDEDVGPDHVLDRVEHPGMMNQRVRPAIEQVRLALLRVVERMALLLLPIFEIGAHLRAPRRLSSTGTGHAKPSRRYCSTWAGDRILGIGVPRLAVVRRGALS